ncbi:MAG TPA: CsgG/HfaB family protein [Stenomitos sp.]
MVGRVAASSLALLVSTTLLSAAPAAAQMRTSKDAQPAVQPNTIQSFAQAIVPSDRPTIAILPPQASLYSPHNDQLYGRLQSALIRLGRFNVLERGKIQALIGERDLARNGYAQPAEVGKLLNAQKLLIAEMTSDPTAQHIYDKKAKSNRFESYARATVRFIDVSTGVAYDAFEVSAEGVDASSRERATNQAMDAIVDQILGAVRSRTRLSAMVTDRSGRRVHLSEGRNIGVQPGQFYDAVDAYGEHIGQLHVTSAGDTQSTAEIVRGYYTINSGLRVIEQAGGRWPFGIGYANRSLILNGNVEGAFNALDLHLNPSGVGLGGGLELGHLSHQGGLQGFGAVLRLEPQMEIVPERFWLYASLGGGLGVYAAPVPTTGELGTSFALNALASVGANVSPFGGLNLFVDGGYMSPWQLNDWQRSVGDRSVPITTPMPNPVIGGAFARAGLSWAF